MRTDWRTFMMEARSSVALRRFPRAFTLIEMLVTVTVLAIVAATVAPMLNNDGRLQVMAAAELVASDIEFAQMMTIAYPSDPMAVCFSAKEKKYWIAYAATPAEPIARPNSGEPYVVEFGVGRATGAADVAMTLNQMTDDSLTFDSSGGLLDFTKTPLIQLGTGSGAITLSIAAMTGSVREIDGPIEKGEKLEPAEVELAKPAKVDK